MQAIAVIRIAVLSAVVALVYWAHTSPALAEITRVTIEEYRANGGVWRS